jgi:hypothetical protein
MVKDHGRKLTESDKDNVTLHKPDHFIWDCCIRIVHAFQHRINLKGKTDIGTVNFQRLQKMRVLLILKFNKKDITPDIKISTLYLYDACC